VNAKQQPASAGTCAKHWSERAAGRCEDCGEEWCAECLVPPVRKRQPLRCIECALIAGGVRSRGGRGTPMNMNRAQRGGPGLF
jgi:hypothetical protein